MKTLTQDQKNQLETEGYLLVEDLLDPIEDIQPVLDEYATVLDGLAARLREEGAISSTYSNLPFTDRLIAICEESGRNFPQHFDFSLPQSGIRPDTPIHTGPAVFRMLVNPRLLDAVEDLIGPEIYSNPVQHIRFKLPRRAVAENEGSGLVARVPWHQDNGVILPEADDATILTVWLPLTAATLENGCLRVVPRSHRSGIQQHCPSPLGSAIPERLVAVEEARLLPMRPGTVLFMTQRTVHSSIDNLTAGEVRISMDLRYQPIGQATGRPAFADAGFVARSRARPETVLKSPTLWAQRWRDLRARLATANVVFNRWKSDAPGCA